MTKHSLLVIGFFAVLGIGLLAWALSAKASLLVRAGEASLWSKMTDEDFSDWNNYIEQVEVDAANGMLYIKTDEYRMYAYDGNSLTNITDPYPSQTTKPIREIAVWDNKLYVACALNTTTDLLTYSNGSWADESSIMPDTMGYIHKMRAVPGYLVVWAGYTEGEGTSQGFFVYNGTEWSLIGDISEFEMVSNNYLDVIDMVGTATHLYALTYDENNTNVVYAYSYSAAEWVVVGDEIYGLYGNMQLYNEELYLGSYFDYEFGPSSVLKLNGETWDILVDDGFDNPDNRDAVLTVWNDALYAATSKPFGGHAELYRYTESDGWEQVSSYIGVAETAQWEENSWVFALTPYNGRLFVATAQAGEGPYRASGWLYGEEPVVADTDHDGVTDVVEMAGPHSGDANGDGTPDYQQAHVTSLVNSITGLYTVLETSCTANTEVSVSQEPGDSLRDEAFDYPLGLVHFRANCGVGATATVKLYVYGDHDVSLMVPRKYDNVRQTYSTISEAEVQRHLVGGQPTVRVTYQVVDGGTLDLDGTANGVIVDPVGVGVHAVGVPNTGIGRLLR